MKNPTRLFVGRSYRLIGLLIVSWCIIAWFSLDYYYTRVANELYQRELQVAMEQLGGISHDIYANIRVLKGVAQVVANDEQSVKAMRRFGAKVKASTLAYRERSHRWKQDPALAQLNENLLNVEKNLDADLIYVVNAAGDCFAASNFQTGETIGSNYVDRTYFVLAQAGKPGHQYAMGRTTNIPGLFYSHPLIENGHFLGTAVVKRDIAKLSDWTNQANAFVSDVNGVIVLARDSRLELRTLPTAAKLTAEQNRLQYKREILEPVSITTWGDSHFPDAVRVGRVEMPAVLVSKTLPEDSLTIYVSRPLDELIRLGTEKYWLFGLMIVVGSLLIFAASAIAAYWRESKRAATKLRIAATAFESQQGMLITDHNNRILQVNKALTDITGYAVTHLIGKNPRIFSSHRQDQDVVFYDEMWKQINQNGSWEGEIWNRRENGSIFPALLSITAVRAPSGVVTNYVGTYYDISASKAAATKIEQLAFYDPLTRLPNRRLLMDRLQHALASATRNEGVGALLFIDVDNFKTLNDTLGHDIGDLLLEQAARRLESCVREADTVARLGGDEFVVLLENLSKVPIEAAAEAGAIGEKILDALNLSYTLNDHEYHITSSIGVTLLEDHLSGIDTLFKQADIAMYQAKKSGRNALRFFDQQMQENVNNRASLEIELRKAVELQQLVLYYQIQMDDSNQAIGAEVLIRWHHPERGWISPSQFIPLAEETGLIIAIGNWALNATCVQLSLWQQSPLTCNLVLAVNVSARQFRQSDFVSQVRAVIKHHAIDPKQLKFELTESMLLDNIENTIATIKALNAIGVKFSLDDFGTGYSSLQYLKRLPLSQIKIDQTFVRDLEVDSSDQAIVRTVISMAQSFGMDIIAEGVETEEQQDFLRAHGCKHYQGYLFGRPVPIAQFVELL